MTKDAAFIRLLESLSMLEQCVVLTVSNVMRSRDEGGNNNTASGPWRGTTCEWSWCDVFEHRYQIESHCRRSVAAIDAVEPALEGGDTEPNLDWVKLLCVIADIRMMESLLSLPVVVEHTHQDLGPSSAVSRIQKKRARLSSSEGPFTEGRNITADLTTSKRVRPSLATTSYSSIPGDQGARHLLILDDDELKATTAVLQASPHCAISPPESRIQPPKLIALAQLRI